MFNAIIVIHNHRRHCELFARWNHTMAVFDSQDAEKQSNLDRVFCLFLPHSHAIAKKDRWNLMAVS